MLCGDSPCVNVGGACRVLRMMMTLVLLVATRRRPLVCRGSAARTKNAGLWSGVLLARVVKAGASGPTVLAGAA